MSSRTGKRRNRSATGCQEPGESHNYATLEAIVRAYKLRFRPRSQEELEAFASESTLLAAVKRAGWAERPDGKRYDHQRRIPRDALEVSANRLRRAKLETARTFDDLYDIVSRAIGSIRGIGELTVYDTALRIGAKLSLAPDRIYLHAGTRVGARKLGLNWREDSLALSDIPEALRELKPREIEDCLCIFEEHFTNIRNRPSNTRLQPSTAGTIVSRRG